MTTTPHPGDRFTGIFSAFMVFCVLVWLWGLGLYMLWPWQKGGEWLPDFPMVVQCQGDTACLLPYADLDAARADGRLIAPLPSATSGELTHEALSVSWQHIAGGMQTKVAAWNFQTTVRYRIDSDRPVLVEYQEINGKLFLLALAGAAISQFLLHRQKRQRKANA